MIDERRFPIQGETRPIWRDSRDKSQGPMMKTIPPTTIPWAVAEAAYVVYHKHWPSQSLETMAARGGFGRDEFIWLLGGANDADWGSVR